MSQRCGLRKSLKAALCQDINVNTLLPKGSEVKAYEFYICCDGCSRVELIVGVAVGSAVGVGVLGLLIRRLVLHARSKNNAKNMSKQKAGKAHSVEVSICMCLAMMSNLTIDRWQLCQLRHHLRITPRTLDLNLLGMHKVGQGRVLSRRWKAQLIILVPNHIQSIFFFCPYC